MPAIRTVGRQLKSLIWRDSIAEQVDAELDFHLEMLTRELMESGLSREAAHARDPQYWWHEPEWLHRVCCEG